MPLAIRLISRAADFAARRHSGQARKGQSGAPYLNHLAEVAALVAGTADGADAELVAAAWLHDVVEDEHATADEVEALFGRRICGLVQELTDDMTLPKEERKRRQVEEIGAKSPGARLLKLADKVSNVRGVNDDPPADWSADELRSYVEWAVSVVDAGCRGIDEGLEAAFDSEVARLNSAATG